MKLSLIVTATENDCIGKDGELPARLAYDRIRFRERTSGKVCILGRNTYDAFSRREWSPLPTPPLVVISSQMAPQESLSVVQSFSEAVDAACEQATTLDQDEIFVIGGAQVFIAALPRVETIYMTRLGEMIGGDTWLPGLWELGFNLVDQSSIYPRQGQYEPPFWFETYTWSEHDA